MTWTPDAVWDRIREAVRTLRAMPGERPAGHRSTCPEPPRSRDDAWLSGGTDGDPLGLYASAIARTQPDRAAIDRMDEVVTVWLSWLPCDEKIALWGLASGIRRMKLMRKLGCKKTKLYELRDRGKQRITDRLNGVRHAA